MAQFKRGPMTLLVVISLSLVAFGVKYAMDNNWIKGFQTTASSVPESDRDLRDFKSDSKANLIPAGSAQMQLPSDEPSGEDFTGLVRTEAWAWQGHNSIKLAIGGPATTKGSLMEKYGVMATFQRQDDTNVLRNQLFACASELVDGARDCRSGIHLTTLMGDQLGAQLAGWNKEFRKLCEDCYIEVVGFGGRSDGEDGFFAPPAVKHDPQVARGLVVAAAPREGDQNIVFFWADQNQIPVNVDQRTYDPEAINFKDANTYIHAAQLYNANSCEPRAEVRKGVRTGKTVQACVDSFTTWTPGDVMATVMDGVARGGAVRIFSTKENSSQMPNSVLIIKRWGKLNFQTVVNFLAAMTEAGEQIRSTNPAALRRSTEIAAKLYGELGNGSEEEKDPKFWLKYYRGDTETDMQGNEVELGGSLAFTLADNLKYWGISGSTDYFRDTYELFGGYMKTYYPNEVSELEPYEQIANKSYIRAVAKLRESASKMVATGVVRKFEQDEEISNVSARSSWTIEFETGQASFTPSAAKTLTDLRRVLSVAQNELVRIEGHTDNVGNPNFNQDLSERRALAVKTWLQEQSSEAFPDNRLQVQGLGQNSPVADNSSAVGRARNRRVDIVLGR